MNCNIRSQEGLDVDANDQRSPRKIDQQRRYKRVLKKYIVNCHDLALSICFKPLSILKFQFGIVLKISTMNILFAGFLFHKQLMFPLFEAVLHVTNFFNRLQDMLEHNTNTKFGNMIFNAE